MKNHQARTAPSRKVPPPPDLEDGYDAIIEYFGKYSVEELEQAGYLEEASPRHVRDVAASATYQLLCEKGLHVKLARKDYERLSRLAAREDVTAEELVKRWIKQRLAEESKRRPGKTQ